MGRVRWGCSKTGLATCVKVTVKDERHGGTTGDAVRVACFTPGYCCVFVMLVVVV